MKVHNAVAAATIAAAVFLGASGQQTTHACDKPGIYCTGDPVEDMWQKIEAATAPPPILETKFRWIDYPPPSFETKFSLR